MCFTVSLLHFQEITSQLNWHGGQLIFCLFQNMEHDTRHDTSLPPQQRILPEMHQTQGAGLTEEPSLGLKVNRRQRTEKSFFVGKMLNHLTSLTKAQSFPHLCLLVEFCCITVLYHRTGLCNVNIRCVIVLWK